MDLSFLKARFDDLNPELIQKVEDVEHVKQQCESETPTDDVTDNSPAGNYEAMEQIPQEQQQQNSSRIIVKVDVEPAVEQNLLPSLPPLPPPLPPIQDLPVVENGNTKDPHKGQSAIVKNNSFNNVIDELANKLAKRNKSDNNSSQVAVVAATPIEHNDHNKDINNNLTNGQACPSANGLSEQSATSKVFDNEVIKDDRPSSASSNNSTQVPATPTNNQPEEGEEDNTGRRWPKLNRSESIISNGTVTIGVVRQSSSPMANFKFGSMSRKDKRSSVKVQQLKDNWERFGVIEPLKNDQF